MRCCRRPLHLPAAAGPACSPLCDDLPGLSCCSTGSGVPARVCGVASARLQLAAGKLALSQECLRAPHETAATRSLLAMRAMGQVGVGLPILGVSWPQAGRAQSFSSRGVVIPLLNRIKVRPAQACPERRAHGRPHPRPSPAACEQGSLWSGDATAVQWGQDMLARAPCLARRVGGGPFSPPRARRASQGAAPRCPALRTACGGRARRSSASGRSARCWRR